MPVQYFRTHIQEKLSEICNVTFATGMLLFLSGKKIFKLNSHPDPEYFNLSFVFFE